MDIFLFYGLVGCDHRKTEHVFSLLAPLVVTVSRTTVSVPSSKKGGEWLILGDIDTADNYNPWVTIIITIIHYDINTIIFGLVVLNLKPS